MSETIVTPEVTVTAEAPRDPPTPTKPLTPVVGAPTPYIRRKIDVVFILGTGDYGEEGKMTIKVTGHRCSIVVNKQGQTAQTTCSARIFGMRFSHMQRLSTFGQRYAAQKQYVIEVWAGDDLAGMTRVFVGTVTNAYFDGEAQPDVAFQVEAFEGAFEALKPAPPISVAGGVDVAETMQALAKQMNVRFENHGVVAKLRDVYYPGTAYQQMVRIAEHAGINALLDDGVLAIWPRGAGRETNRIPLISKLSGMKNYPLFNSQGIIVTCLFQPLTFGAKIAIQTSLWNNQIRHYYVYGYTYSLDSEIPDGQWFATFKANTIAP